MRKDVWSIYGESHRDIWPSRKGKGNLWRKPSLLWDLLSLTEHPQQLSIPDETITEFESFSGFPTFLSNPSASSSGGHFGLLYPEASA